MSNAGINCCPTVGQYKYKGLICCMITVIINLAGVNFIRGICITCGKYSSSGSGGERLYLSVLDGEAVFSIMHQFSFQSLIFSFISKFSMSAFNFSSSGKIDIGINSFIFFSTNSALSLSPVLKQKFAYSTKR